MTNELNEIKERNLDLFIKWLKDSPLQYEKHKSNLDQSIRVRVYNQILKEQKNLHQDPCYIEWKFDKEGNLLNFSSSLIAR